MIFIKYQHSSKTEPNLISNPIDRFFKRPQLYIEYTTEVFHFW